MSIECFLDTARRVLTIEATAITDAKLRLTDEFNLCISTILESNGKVIICGMGKSGIIGKKIAATLSSTGTSSFFMHPGEAYHGDLGMVSPNDIFIAISNSGETEEVVKLLPFLNESNNVLIAVTGNTGSTLARSAKFHLDVSVEEEACPLQLAPTASTTVTLAMGDALAVALMEARQFKPEHFAKYHPGGALGRRLLSTVADYMVTTNLPIIKSTASLIEVVEHVTKGCLGLGIVQDSNGFHVITDGDLRRILEKYKESVFNLTANDFMTEHPLSVPQETRMEDAYSLMERAGVSSLLVVKKEELIGIVKK